MSKKNALTRRNNYEFMLLFYQYYWLRVWNVWRYKNEKQSTSTQLETSVFLTVLNSCNIQLQLLIKIIPAINNIPTNNHNFYQYVIIHIWCIFIFTFYLLFVLRLFKINLYYTKRNIYLTKLMNRTKNERNRFQFSYIPTF